MQKHTGMSTNSIMCCTACCPKDESDNKKDHKSVQQGRNMAWTAPTVEKVNSGSSDAKEHLRAYLGNSRIRYIINILFYIIIININDIIIVIIINIDIIIIIIIDSIDIFWYLYFNFVGRITCNFIIDLSPCFNIGLFINKFRIFRFNT